jgi:hypothetical protein
MSMIGIGGMGMGGARPMSPQEALTEEEERQRRVENIVRGTGTSIRTDPTGIGAYFDLVNQGLEGNRKVASEPVVGLNMPGRVPTNPQVYGLAGRTAGVGTPGQAPQKVLSPLEQALAYAESMQGRGGGGVAAPDYSQYRTALTDQAQQINAQIQAMYNALGEEAGANVGRIQDIYGGASTGIGDVYGSAIGNVGDAYSSAQQQAADQLARLGIEGAAPAVVNPMALSQAEAISQLEQGQAGGQAATERFGSAASGFGSQMAQVAQQQGTEMNAAVLAALQNRLNESLLMEEQGRQAAASGGGGGGGNILESAMDFLRLQEMANAPAMAQQELDLRAAEIAADNRLSQEGKLVTLWSDIRNDYDSDDEAQQAAEEALRRAQAFFG